MRVIRTSEGVLNASDALVVHQYRNKHQWVPFNDDLIDETPEGIDLVERSDDWSRVRTTFRRIGSDDQQALQMVVIDGMSLRKTGQQLGVSAMTVQRRVKHGLNSLANELNGGQAGV